MMRARTSALMAIVACTTLALGAGCSGKKKKSILEKKREAEAAALARLNAKNFKNQRPPRPEMTPERFAEIVAQSFGDAQLPLIDPEGRIFSTPERQWERDLRFDAGNPAWNAKTGVLYGASRRGKDVVALDLQGGALATRGANILRPVPKKVDPKKMAKNEHLQSMEPVFELTPGGLVVAQSVPVKGELEIKVFGVDVATGRVRWRAKVPNPWDDGFTLWSEGNFVFLGDATKGPVHLFDSTTGTTGKVVFPEGETYAFGGANPQIAVFYHIRKSGELYLAGHGRDGVARWRKPLGDCYGNMSYLQAFVDGVLPCKVRTSPKEHIDRAIKINFADGKTLWETDWHKRPQDAVTDAQRKDMITVKAGTGGAVYMRNRFEMVRLNPDGKAAWRYPLADKEIYLLIDGKTYRSENVMAGDEPYEAIVNLDPQTGAPLWSYKEEKGLPARGLIREGSFIMWGDTQARIFDLKSGKLLANRKLLPRVEAVAVSQGVGYFDAMGARQAYRLSDNALVLYDKSEEETIVNNWLEMPFAKELYLYHDTERRLGRLQPAVGDMRMKVDPKSVRAAKLLSPPPVEVDGVRWLDGQTLEFQTVDDKRAWKVSLAGGAPTVAGARKDNLRASPTGALAFNADPVKVEEKTSLKVEARGKTTVVTAFPMGEFAWSHSGHELAYAERRPPSYKSRHAELADLVLRVFDARSGQSRDVMHLKGVEKAAVLASVSFGPGDKSLTFALENLYGSHFVGTVAATKKTVGEMRISEVDGEVTVKLPRLLPPTMKLGLDQGETFGEVAWSPDGQTLAYTRGQRLVLLSKNGRELLSKPESAVSIMKWGPRGGQLLYVKDGNLWRWRGGKAERLSYFITKREPRNDEEQKYGNLLRMHGMALSPDGSKLALGLRWPYEGNMRAAVIDLR